MWRRKHYGANFNVFLESEKLIIYVTASKAGSAINVSNMPLSKTPELFQKQCQGQRGLWFGQLTCSIPCPMPAEVKLKGVFLPVFLPIIRSGSSLFYFQEIWLAWAWLPLHHQHQSRGLFLGVRIILNLPYMLQKFDLHYSLTYFVSYVHDSRGLYHFQKLSFL